MSIDLFSRKFKTQIKLKPRQKNPLCKIIYVVIVSWFLFSLSVKSFLRDFVFTFSLEDT